MTAPKIRVLPNVLGNAVAPNTLSGMRIAPAQGPASAVRLFPMRQALARRRVRRVRPRSPDHDHRGPVVVTLVADAPAAHARTAVPARDAAPALIEAELRWTDAVRRGDRADAGSFMTDGFTMLSTGSHGAPIGRAAWLERVSVPSTLVAFEYDDFRIRVIGDEALVESRCRESARRNGETDAGDATTFDYTDVWQREGDRWRIGLRHVGLS